MAEKQTKANMSGGRHEQNTSDNIDGNRFINFTKYSNFYGLK